MTTERAVLAGGCFWGMQDLIRKRPGVKETRVGYTGGDVPNATYRNHGTHAEGIEILFDPAVLFRHVLRNALIPILTNVGLALPGVLIGSFLIEVYFSIPGIGREVLLAVNRSDYPVIQAATVYLAMLTMLINLATDVLYTVVDPRVTLK